MGQARGGLHLPYPLQSQTGLYPSPLLPPAGQVEEQHSEPQKLYYPRQQYRFELCCLKHFQHILLSLERNGDPRKPN